MARWRAEITSPYVGDGSFNNIFRQQLGDTYSVFTEDVTALSADNMTPSPNLLNILVECDTVVLEAIEKDNTYLIVWAEEEL